MRPLLLWTDLDVIQLDFPWDEIYRLSSLSFSSQKTHVKHVSCCGPHSWTAVDLKGSITCSVPIVFSTRRNPKRLHKSELGTQRADQYTGYTGYTRYSRYTLYSRCSRYTWYNRYAQPIFSYTGNSLVSDHSWCTRKWSLKGGGRLCEKSIKKTLQLNWLTWLQKVIT